MIDSEAHKIAKGVADVAKFKRLDICIAPVGDRLGEDAGGNVVIQGDHTVTFRNHIVIISPKVWEALKEIADGRR